MQLLIVHVRRLNIYSMTDKNKTIKQIVESMQQSMIGYEVTGTPEGRLWRLREIASYILARIKQTNKE